MELLSVVLTNYNNEKWIGQCIDSILGQTYISLDIIIVDDGSTDGSRDIIYDYAQKDVRIRVVEKQHEGAASARKEGLKVAKGRYVTFPDGDDYLDKDLYKYMMDRMRIEDVDVVCNNVYIKENDGNSEIAGIEFDEGCYRKGDLRDLKGNIFSIAPSLWLKIFKREKIEPFINEVDSDTRVSNDMQASYPALMNTESVYMMCYPAYHYRVGHRGKANISTEIKIKSYVLTYCKLYQCMKENENLLKVLDEKILSSRIVFMIRHIYSWHTLRSLRNSAPMRYYFDQERHKLHVNEYDERILDYLKRRRYLRIILLNKIEPFIKRKNEMFAM